MYYGWWWGWWGTTKSGCGWCWWWNWGTTSNPGAPTGCGGWWWWLATTWWSYWAAWAAWIFVIRYPVSCWYDIVWWCKYECNGNCIHCFTGNWTLVIN